MKIYNIPHARFIAWLICGLCAFSSTAASTSQIPEQQLAACLKHAKDLRNPPSNNLELLKGDRKGNMSIRVNRQWRICFRWDDGEAHDVKIVDYH